MILALLLTLGIVALLMLGSFGIAQLVYRNND
jgi:hypothetical protein